MGDTPKPSAGSILFETRLPNLPIRERSLASFGDQRNGLLLQIQSDAMSISHGFRYPSRFYAITN